jgi:CheY-like chemotaxis protein
VLLIEQTPAVAAEMTAWLALYDVDVLTFESGMPGFWAAVYAHPDVILCGNWEPGKDELSYVDRLQSDPRTIGIPLIVMTCSDRPGLKRQMQEIGVEGCLRQPVVMTDLMKELRRHISLMPRRRPAAFPSPSTGCPSAPAADQTCEQATDALQASVP